MTLRTRFKNIKLQGEGYMKLYVTRHGQSEWNYENKVCGISDINLTEKGIEQAKELAAKLENYNIDIIISSPLRRARKTAEIISSTIGKDIIIDNRLFEQNFGVYEGGSRDSLNFKESKKQFTCKPSGGESLFQVVHRVYNLIEEIKEKYPDKTILLVGHGSVSRIINTYFDDISNEEFYRFNLGNCELKEYNI